MPNEVFFKYNKRMKESVSSKKRILLAILIPIIGIVVLSASVFGAAYGYLTRDTIKVDLDESITFQQINYFGASSCWNFRLLGKEEDLETQTSLIDYLYSEDGLNLNVFRYNLGAGSLELETPEYTEACLTDTFFIKEKYVNSDSFLDASNYDFSKDADYMSMLKLSLDRGNVDKLVIFSNSPHYLLTKNGLTHADNEHENNLEEANFKAFANYVLISAKGIKDALDSWGYSNIKIYLSPVNEPQWKWGGSAATQEGCHYDYDHLAKFYDVFYKELVSFNASTNANFTMDIFESGNYKLGLASSKNKKYFNEFSKYEYFEEVKEISMHSYAAETNKSIRRKFQKYFSKYNKDFVMSEYCVMEFGVDESVSMGIKSAKVLMQDLNIMNAVEWDWWLGVANGGFEDGLVYFNRETKEINKYYRYYMLGQFMKYIPHGATRIKADIHDLNDIGGVDCAAFTYNDQVIIVILNDNKKEKNINFELSNIASGKVIETYENTYWQESSYNYNGGYTVKPNSVTTIILNKEII